MCDDNNDQVLNVCDEDETQVNTNTASQSNKSILFKTNTAKKIKVNHIMKNDSKLVIIEDKNKKRT